MWPSDFVRDLVLYGLLLNAVWELVQFRTLYACWRSWSTRQRLVFLPAAVLGDVLAVLAITYAAQLLIGPNPLIPPGLLGWTVLLGLGLVAGVVLEWIALCLGLWSYTESMPTLRVGGRRLGLAPVLQITMLPAVSVQLAAL